MTYRVPTRGLSHSDQHHHHKPDPDRTAYIPPKTEPRIVLPTALIRLSRTSFHNPHDSNPKSKLKVDPDASTYHCLSSPRLRDVDHIIVFVQGYVYI